MSIKWYSKAALPGNPETSAGCKLMADLGNADDLFYAGHYGESTGEMSGYIQWAKDKIEWLDPFIAKPDLYLDSWEQEEVKVNTSQSYSQRRENDDSSTGYSFWRKPYWRKK